MQISIDVRPASPRDLPHLLDLWERSVRSTHDFLSENDILGLRPLVADELAAPTIAWWVAVITADVPIAFLGYTSGVVEGLFVDPAHRGRGAGTRLIAHAQSLASGPLRVDVNEQNVNARGFYESLGFEIVGRSATDGDGRPFPIVHMVRATPSG